MLQVVYSPEYKSLFNELFETALFISFSGFIFHQNSSNTLITGFPDDDRI